MLMKKKTMIWRLKLFLFVLLLGVSLFLLLFPLYVNHQDRQLGKEMKKDYETLVAAMGSEKVAYLKDYEEQYNAYLFKQQTKEQIPVPAKQFFQETNNQLGILSIAAVGIRNRGIAYPPPDNEHLPMLSYVLGSSLPGENTSTHVRLKLPDVFSSQALVEQFAHVRKGDIIQLETYQGIQTYRVFSNRLAGSVQSELEKTSFVLKKNYLSIDYTPSFLGTTRIQAERVSSVQSPRLTVSRFYLSYGAKCLIGCTGIIGGFLILVFYYQVYIQKFYSTKVRTVQTTQRQLYKLLQITKSYVLIVGLIAALYLCLISFRFLN